MLNCAIVCVVDEICVWPRTGRNALQLRPVYEVACGAGGVAVDSVCVQELIRLIFASGNAQVAQIIWIRCVAGRHAGEVGAVLPGAVRTICGIIGHLTNRHSRGINRCGVLVSAGRNALGVVSINKGSAA